MMKLSATSLKAYLACPRSYWLSHVARAPKIVPAYVAGGRNLDAAVQSYLAGTPGADGPDLDSTTASELATTRPELPHPGTVIVQPKLSVPCPGLEDRVRIEGTLDALTPPSADKMVVIDLKRVWHADAAHTQASLADDIQAQLYAWLTWQVHAPVTVLWRWVYCVRAVVSAKGEVTRKPKAFSVDVKADRARVDAWFGDVVLPAARGMLDIRGPVDAVEHDPDSCESGNRCFVAKSCPMFKGPIKGAIHVDLSRFKTNAAVVAERIVPNSGITHSGSFGPAAEMAARAREAELAKAAEAIVLDAEAKTVTINPEAFVAINPPALVQAASRETDAPDTVLDVAQVEGSPEALAMLGVEAESAEAFAALPAPKRRSRRKNAKERLLDEIEAAVQADEAPATVPAPVLTLDNASTEQLRDELVDRGYRVTLESRS